ncbi:MAG: hypothetical protein AABZ60_14965 [Planctomycetota bacterium]
MNFPTIFILLVTLFFSGCQSSRPFVVTNATQLGDLYYHGELTDSEGHRWNVMILPGIRPMARWSAESFEECGDSLSSYGKKSFWNDCGKLAEDSLEFSKDSLVEYGWEGIGDDFENATKNISDNASQAPFGWIPRIIGNVFWGYVLKPAFRITTAPVGAAMGACGTLILPAGYALAPIGYTIGNSTLNGILIPTLGITAHQLVYLMVLPNREPSESMDGSFGLYIINPESKTVEKTPEMTLSPEDLKKLFLLFLQLKKAQAEYEWRSQEYYKASDQQTQLDADVNAWHSGETLKLSPETQQYLNRQFKKDFEAQWNKMQQSNSENIAPYWKNLDGSFQEFQELLNAKVPSIIISPQN